MLDDVSIDAGAICQGHLVLDVPKPPQAQRDTINKQPFNHRGVLHAELLPHVFKFIKKPFRGVQVLTLDGQGKATLHRVKHLRYPLHFRVDPLTL